MNKVITYDKTKKLWIGKITFVKNGINTIVFVGKSKSKDVIEGRLQKYKI